MGNTRKVTVMLLVAGACASDAWAEDYKITKDPAWMDGSAFGWACDPEAGENQECAFVGQASRGVSPPGEEAFAKRFRWRAEVKEEAKKAKQRGECRLHLEFGGMREVMVARLRSGTMGEISDSRCGLSFSPDGTLVGLYAAWADFEGTEDRHARVYTIEGFESLYWSILALKNYRKSPEEAVAWFHHALALDPGDSRSRYKLACALALMGKGEEALIQLAEAVSMRPKLRKQAKKDRDLRSLKSEEDFKLLINAEEGWKEIRARLGTPGPDALPPGLEEARKVEVAEPEPEPEPEVVEEPPVEEPGFVEGLLRRVGCSEGVVG